MRIGLDGMPLAQPKTGIGAYTFELAIALAAAAPDDDFELVSPLPFQPPIIDDVKPANLNLVHRKANVLERRWWAIGLPAYLRRNPVALFHGTNYEIPLRANCPTIVTIHDLSLLLHSSTHEAGAVRRARLLLPLMARRATLIITDSQLVRGEVRERLKIDADKIFVVPLAPGGSYSKMPLEQTAETRKRLGIEDHFLLFVGTVEPRKNLSTLLRAFETILRTTGLRPQLVIAGQMGWKRDALLSQLQNSPARDRVVFSGYLPDADLRALYSSCSAFVYPSVYEGFGLPALEAMACGAPVIASRVPSVTEFGETPARIVSATDVEDLARSIVELLSDANERQQLAEAGLKYAGRFSWQQTAALTREVYGEALKRKSRVI